MAVEQETLLSAGDEETDEAKALLAAHERIANVDKTGGQVVFGGILPPAPKAAKKAKADKPPAPDALAIKLGGALPWLFPDGTKPHLDLAIIEPVTGELLALKQVCVGKGGRELVCVAYAGRNDWRTARRRFPSKTCRPATGREIDLGHAAPPQVVEPRPPLVTPLLPPLVKVETPTAVPIPNPVPVPVAPTPEPIIEAELAPVVAQPRKAEKPIPTHMMPSGKSTARTEKGNLRRYTVAKPPEWAQAPEQVDVPLPEIMPVRIRGNAAPSQPMLFGTNAEEKERGVAGNGINEIFSRDDVVDEALHYFRETGFPYYNMPPHVCMQEINRLASITDVQSLMGSTVAHHVGDTYHPERFHAIVAERVPVALGFQEDEVLLRALREQLKQGDTIPAGYFPTLHLVAPVAPASNFRPGLALAFYRRFCPEGPPAVILDTSMGFGGRLVGFMASGLAGLYIGIDPNPQVVEGNRRMAQELGFADHLEMYQLPSEDVPVERLAGRCDFAMTSPPYFSKEVYDGAAYQAGIKFAAPESWRVGFLIPLMRLQYAALKPGAYAVINIQDVRLGNLVYPLVDWTKEAGRQAGFVYNETVEVHAANRYKLGSSFGRKGLAEVRSEPFLIFRKPPTNGQDNDSIGATSMSYPTASLSAETVDEQPAAPREDEDTNEVADDAGDSSDDDDTPAGDSDTDDDDEEDDDDDGDSPSGD